MRFNDKVVLVTGAASGIGAATVALFRGEGAIVIGLDRAEADGVVRCDVTDEADVERAVADAVAEHGRLDVVCNVAGILRRQPFETMTLDTWQQVIDVNLTGPFLVARATIGHLLESGGCMVNVGSISGMHGQPHNSAYCASKGGVIQLSRALAVEYADRGVRVNCVCPGGVNTPMIADPAIMIAEDVPQNDQANLRMVPLMPGFTEPDEIAEAIAYLASDAARSISGASLVVDRATLS